jgi:hypothetical protein
MRQPPRTGVCGRGRWALRGRRAVAREVLAFVPAPQTHLERVLLLRGLLLHHVDAARHAVADDLDLLVVVPHARIRAVVHEAVAAEGKGRGREPPRNKRRIRVERDRPERAPSTARAERRASRPRRRRPRTGPSCSPAGTHRIPRFSLSRRGAVRLKLATSIPAEDESPPCASAGSVPGTAASAAPSREQKAPIPSAQAEGKGAGGGRWRRRPDDRRGNTGGSGWRDRAHAPARRGAHVCRSLSADAHWKRGRAPVQGRWRKRTRGEAGKFATA